MFLQIFFFFVPNKLALLILEKYKKSQFYCPHLVILCSFCTRSHLATRSGLLADVKMELEAFLDAVPDEVKLAATVIGLYFVGTFALGCLWSVYAFMLRPGKNLKT